ncbi:MAG TPA: sigma-70 family RNA polymerase sigma factor [Lysobacter sp.]
MDYATATFTQLRPRLLGIGYRMLGSLAEAEDMVQDVWMRWADASRQPIGNAEAWLVAAATRDSIDRLRSARTARERCAGMWLPGPILADGPATPEQMCESWDDLSIAFLALLERLAPEARAAFLLREVFDVDYPAIAAILGKREAACRQIVHRANAQLQQGRVRNAVPAGAHRRLMGRFADAVARADLGAMTALLHDTRAHDTDDEGFARAGRAPAQLRASAERPRPS